jgi:imidazolonepropionase-like amidohydrolase
VAEPVPSRREARFEVLIAGNPAGAMTETAREGGVRDTTYEFNDRGRGPHLSERVSYDEAGLPRQVRIVGHDHLKAPVEEQLIADAGRLRWSNGAEQGASSERGFYLPFYGTPALQAAVARALLQAPGRTLPLLPAGSGRVEPGTALTVSAAGRSQVITRYDLIGLDFEPMPLWLDAEGELFAIASEWFSVVRAGWKEVLPQLIADQHAAQGARLQAIAAATTVHPPPAGLALTSARIFDARTGRSAAGTVVIRGERIVAVGPRVPIPAGAQVIDLAGKTLLPGLWDMHVHVGPLDGILQLAAGVTTVRDLANDVDLVASLKRSWDSGAVQGPRLLLAGFIDGRGPFQGPTKVFADTDQEARDAVKRYAELGYPQIKLYSSLKPALVPGIIADAHARGLRVSGHVPSGMLAQDFVEAGADELQHINFLFLNFLATREEDTRTPLRFQRVADRAGSLDLDGPAVKAFLALLARRHVVVDPTVSAIEALLLDRRGEVAPGVAAVADRLPAVVRRGTLGGGLPVPEGQDATYRASAHALLELVKRLHRAGVTLVAGTDGLGGFTLHHELARYVEAGLSAPEVLSLATLGAARVMKLDRELGSIEAGKLADLVVIDGAPDRVIADLERVALVIKGGAVHDAPAMYRAIGVGPYR